MYMVDEAEMWLILLIPCGGPVRIIASIEDPDVIPKIFQHLDMDQPVDPQNRSPLSELTDHSTTLF